MVALVRALQRKLPLEVKLYLAAQYIAALFTSTGLVLGAYPSTLYTTMYLAATSLVLIASFVIVALRSSWQLNVLGVFLGWVLGFLAYWQSRPFPAEYWIPLLQASVLIWFGTALGYAAHRSVLHSGTLLKLALLWSMLGLFNFGFLLHHWAAANAWFPSFACFAVFTSLGIESGRNANLNRRALREMSH
jgi:hypothetical protein